MQAINTFSKIHCSALCHSMFSFPLPVKNIQRIVYTNVLTVRSFVLRRQFYVRRIFHVPPLEQKLVLGQLTLRQLQGSNVSKVFIHLVTEEEAGNHCDTHADSHGALVQLVVQSLLPLSHLEARIHRR